MGRCTLESEIRIIENGSLASVPMADWRKLVLAAIERGRKRLDFMSEDHHSIRRTAVTEMVRTGQPVPPEALAHRLGIPIPRTTEILDELERRLFFLVRSSEGAVSWAFPVTTDKTPHKLTFSTGERLYGAWAEDAFIAPFVQGRLTDRRTEATIDTVCAHCDQTMQIVVDSEMRHEARGAGSKPLFFEPQIDWPRFREPNIIHAYWRNSVFFWSEDHALEYFEAGKLVNGELLTLEQGACVSPLGQAALFGLD